MPGPPPKDPSQRRRPNSNPGFKLLPREGRQAPAPDWPLADFATEAELTMWKRVWKLPQAVEWERMQCEDIVALYVRAFVAASKMNSGNLPNAKLLMEVRQLDAKIGLSPKSLRDLRLEIAEAEAPGEEPEPNGNGKPRTYVPKEQ